jgi:hypothetical protein
MKWYSVKKFIPACSGYFFVKGIKDKIGLLFWDCEKWTDHEMLIEFHAPFDVTHFCIPDPIEIEE